MKVLILGGTGIISSGITQACLARGHDVLHFNRGHREAPATVRRLTGDRNRREDLEAAAALRPDVVIDMLGFQPEQARLVVDAFSGHAQQLVFCSTACVYAPAPRRFPNEEQPADATWHYGRAKRECEEVVLKAHREGRLAVTVFRPAHVFDNTFVVHQLGMDAGALNRIHRDLPVLCLDGGRALWQPMHARDAGEAFAAACLNPRCYGKTYNLSHAEPPPSWRECYEAMGRAVGRDVRLHSLDSEALARGGRAEAYEFSLHIARHDFAVDASRVHADLPELRRTVSFEDGLRRAWHALRETQPGFEYDEHLTHLLETRATPV